MERLKEITGKVENILNCTVDYVWYVAERFGKTTQNPKMTGSNLFFILWIWIVMLPFIGPLLYHNLGCEVAVVAGICFLFLPSLFCRIRYKYQRREMLNLKFGHINNLGIRLIGLYLLGILLMIASFALSLYIGLLRFTGK